MPFYKFQEAADRAPLLLREHGSSTSLSGAVALQLIEEKHENVATNEERVVKCLEKIGGQEKAIRRYGKAVQALAVPVDYFLRDLSPICTRHVTPKVRHLALIQGVGRLQVVISRMAYHCES